jgi:hypothetical protein
MMNKTQSYLHSKIPFGIMRKIEVDYDTGCWLWLGEKNRNGYGRAWWKGQRFMVHRLVWMLLGRPLDDDKILDHLCSVRNCCNPTHMSAVTHQHNTHRGKAVLFK